MADPRFRIEIDAGGVSRWRRRWFGRWNQVSHIRRPEIERILIEIVDAVTVDDICIWLAGGSVQVGAHEDDDGFVALCDWIDCEFALAGSGWREEMAARAIRKPLTPEIWQVWSRTDDEALD